MSSKYKGFPGLLVIGMLLILVLMQGMALEEDFHAFAESENLAVCSCGLRESNLVIENTGDITSKFRISKSGEGAKWASYTESSLVLEPAESRSVRQFINVPCDVAGRYALQTHMETEFGLEQDINQVIDVDTCVNLHLAPVSDFRKTTCPCTPETFEFELQNTQNFPDTFELYVEPDGYATVSEPLVLLGPGESKIVSVFINFPCEVFGDRTFELVAVSQANRIEGRHPFWLDIEACYGYGIQMKERYEACQYVLNRIPVTITNTADIANFYDLSLQGKRWASLENESVFLYPGQQAETGILLDPQSAAPGAYSFRLDTVTERGEIEQEKEFIVDLQSCFDLNLIPEAVSPITVVSCEPQQLGMLVQNIGTKQTEFGVNLEGPSFVSVDVNTFMLNPGEERIVRQNIQPPCSLVEGFSTRFVARVMDVSYIAQQIVTQFETVPLPVAYAVDIDAEDSYRVRYVPTENYFTLTNNGIRTGQYTLQLAAPAWMFLNETAVVLEPGQEKTLSLITQPTEEVEQANYQVGIQAGLVNPYGQDVRYVREFEIRLREKSMFMTVLPWILGMLLLAIIGAGTYWYVTQKPKRKPTVKLPKLKKIKEKKFAEEFIKFKVTPTFWKVFALIGILLLLILLAYFTSPLLKEGFEAPKEEGVAEEEGIIVVDPDAGLRVQDGVVFIRGETEVPLIIRNRESGVTYDFTVQLPEWITADKDRVAIPPNTEGRLTLQVDPRDQPAGDYVLDFDIGVRGTTQTREESLTLRIVRMEAWQQIVLWVVLGILLLIILIVVLQSKLGKRPERREAILEGPERVKKPFLERTKEILSRKEVKRTLWFLIPLLLIVLLLALAFTTPLFQREDNRTLEERFEEKVEEIERIEGAEIALGEEGEEQVIKTDERGVLIPIRLSNDQSDAKYVIHVQEAVDWITPDKEVLEIPPRSDGVVTLAVDPRQGVRQGKYNIQMDVTLEGSELFKQGIILDYEKSLASKLMNWLLFIILGAAILAGLIYYLQKKEGKKARVKEVDIKV